MATQAAREVGAVVSVWNFGGTPGRAPGRIHADNRQRFGDRLRSVNGSTLLPRVNDMAIGRGGS